MVEKCGHFDLWNKKEPAQYNRPIHIDHPVLLVFCGVELFSRAGVLFKSWTMFSFNGLLVKNL